MIIMNVMVYGHMTLHQVIHYLRAGNDGFGNCLQGKTTVHAQLLHGLEGVLFCKFILVHQDALGPVQYLACFQVVLGFVQRSV